MKRRPLLVMMLALALAGVRPARAQPQQPQQPQQSPPPQDAKAFSPQQLDQILAPIALYSDALLSQMLMAASYPIEIVEAARWVKANPNVKGEAAVQAVQNQTWDVSVKSLVAFPSALMQLNDHLDWTQKLGDAMVSQQQDVADSIQRLRAKAEDAGNLKSGQQQTVTTQGSGADRTIVIEPTNPDVVYVPSYNPTWAYGGWSDPAYPPVYYPPPAGYGYGTALASGLLWGLAFAGTSAALYGGWNWARGAGYVNINSNRAVNVDRNFDRNRYNNSNRWQHDAGHRRGVAYRDAATRQQFGQNRPGADQRQQFRGQVANRPQGGGVGQGGQRPNIGQGGQRPNIGQGGQRPNIGQGGQRPGGGQRVQNRPNAGGARGSGISGVNRGQQVNREAARGRVQQNRAAGHPRGGGGARGGGGGRPGGGGGRPGGRR